MRLFERWADFYFFHSKCILSLCLLISSIAIVQGLIVMRSQIRYTIYKTINKVLYCVVIATMAILLNNIGISFEIKYDYFNVIFFSFTIIAIILYEIIQGIIFKAIKEPILQGMKNIQYTIFFTIFLLGITSKLSLFEWCTGTSLFASIQLILYEIEKNVKKEKIDHSIESDYPSSDLYYTRNKQLDSFIPILRQQRDEPYAIMVSGEWGLGKTSFLKAIEEKLSEDDFLWIHAGSELSVSDIMTQISDKILEILKSNNIFIEKDSVIEKYFLAFAGVVGESKFKIYNRLSRIMGVDKEYRSKDYLNRKLSKLKTTIYLVIDDLDRCDEEYQNKMFKVIRESTDLTNCKTIFVVDKSKFLVKSNYNNIEKYVTYTLDLCEVGYDEIASYLIDVFFGDTFMIGINSVFSKDRSSNELKKEIYELPLHIIDVLEEEKTKIEDKIRYDRNSESDKEIYKKEIKDIADVLQIIRKNITISRKVKMYFKDIKNNLNNLSLEIDECSREYKSEDWFGAVLKVQFIKHFLPDYYTEIKKYKTLQEFGKSYNGYSISSILGLKYGFLLSNGKMEDVLNLIIYKFDIINFKEVKTKNSKNYEEMYDEEKATIKHINEYLGCCHSYCDLYRILEICKKEKFEDNEKKFEFIKNIMGIMSKQSSQLKANNEEFLVFSKSLVKYFESMNLEEKEKNIVIHEGNMVIRRVIVDNTALFRNVLDILFDVTDVTKEWKLLTVTDVDEFCRMLSRLDKNSTYGHFINEEEHLPQLIKYYENLHRELTQEKYVGVRLNFDTIFNKINIIFEICTFWSEIEKKLEDEDATKSSVFDQYFVLKGVNSFNNIVFNDVDKLVDALEELKKFYASKKQNYESNYSLILLRVLYNSILMYEQKPEWYKAEICKINALFAELSEMVLNLDYGEDVYSRDAIEKIKIYTYKFNQYSMKSNE